MRRRSAFKIVPGQILGAVASIGLMVGVPRPAAAWGTIEVGVTAGPGSFLERSAFLRMEPWDFLAADAEAAFADSEAPTSPSTTGSGRRFGVRWAWT